MPLELWQPAPAPALASGEVQGALQGTAWWHKDSGVLTMPPSWKVPGLLQVPQLLQGRGQRVSALTRESDYVCPLRGSRVQGYNSNHVTTFEN